MTVSVTILTGAATVCASWRRAGEAQARAQGRRCSAYRDEVLKLGAEASVPRRTRGRTRDLRDALKLAYLSRPYAFGKRGTSPRAE